MAESPSDFVTMEELTERVSQFVVEPTPSTVLSPALGDLKQAQYGAILRDVNRPALDGLRVYNLSAFRDPRMKAFIRVMNAVEERGLLPSVAEVHELPSTFVDDGEEEGGEEEE